MLLRLAVFILAGATVLAIVQEGLGWGLILLALLVARFARRRWPGTGDTHGAAAFAGPAEVQAAGMTAIGAGLHLGELIVTGPRPAVLPAVAGLFTVPWSQSVAAIENLRQAVGHPPPRLRLWSDFKTCSIFAASRSGVLV
ncbi:hypothetical protein FTUN_2954 [Frigoriglobus tundricola]|uniref:Uncharacterized protein n=1 Tax=Frigoriglobus tundricola TaxID=2774151 RepID=A0A6M5YN64_9BACT|nr:hypothetical protein FTUN_2954 [Frigoriglobus tundricola]